MSIDELIDKALKSAGGVWDPSNLYALAGEPKTEELFVLDLESFLMDNFGFFIRGEDVGLILLGVYNTEQAARESIQCIQEKSRLSATGLVLAPSCYVLIADMLQNSLYSITSVQNVFRSQ